MKKSQCTKNLIQGIIIRISCGGDKTTKNDYTLYCDECNHVNSYEVA